MAGELGGARRAQVIAALAVLIFLPNLAWQVQHHFISLQFLSSIHDRDIQIGRTNLYLVGQLLICTNLGMIMLWINGLRYYGLQPEGRQYRPLAWMTAVPFFLFLVGQGRYYYLAPVYPMLIAAGSWLAERRLSGLSEPRQRNQWNSLYTGLAVSSVIIMAMSLPLAPVNSGWWKVTTSLNSEPREEIGWPELVQTVASIRDSLPASEKARLGILAGNYGEAGAINLLGPAYGLPHAISGIDSYWLRGYWDQPPETLIVLGLRRMEMEQIFESCQLAGHSSNHFDIQNEETRDHPEIFICRKLRQPWPEFWNTPAGHALISQWFEMTGFKRRQDISWLDLRGSKSMSRRI